MEFQALIEHVDEDVLATIPPGESRRYHALPLMRLPSGLRIAIADPLDFETLDALRYLLKTDLEPVVVPLAKLDEAIVRFFGKTDESLASLMANMDGSELELKKQERREGTRQQRRRPDYPVGLRLDFGSASIASQRHPH